METIDADRAAELIFELLKKNPWLVRTGELIESDFNFEEEAVDFLHKMIFFGADSFGNTSIPARRIVTGLLTELLASLMHPESSLRENRWDVDDSKPSHEQALTIIFVETVESYRHSGQPH
ncbi:hypothetical protein [Nitrosomonas oligotropha]|uniref:hypothetical protein n=1 Tax=Nitrosomonas oligotropha TaxID=42354 RepID=UPI00136E0AAF|nr:hypothetical protein [Nitrosomonas oligotropha]MXS82238.1 hypothetical protein [Nitrosomonas oligotropha]